MYWNQPGFIFPEHPSASPTDLRPNVPFIGGFMPPTSTGGFISPTPHNTVVDMPVAYPCAISVPPQANHLFVAPLNPKRRSSPTPGRVSPVHVQRASADPNFGIWELRNTVEDMTRSHRTTLPNETNASIQTVSSGRTSASYETRVSASTAGTFMSAQLARSTPLPSIDTSFGALKLSDNEVFAPEDTNSPDLTPNPTPTGADPLDRVAARTETVRGTIRTEQASTPADTITPTEVTISSGTTITTLSKTQMTPIGSHTPASEVITQLCIHGCRNLTDELDPSSISIRPVGNGGFGQVYRAYLKNGTDIALKILGIHGKNEVKHLKHAAHELHVWSKCSHPNVAPLLGLAEFDGRIAMVSPWMENGDLSHYLTENIAVDKLGLCLQIASALAHLHSINIVHGDLKGPNVLVSNDGTPVLIDFGNAILSEYTLQFTQTTTKHDMSLRWTAPELMNDEKPSYKSDVYALGMYRGYFNLKVDDRLPQEIFTGKTPYYGMRDPAVIFNVGTWKRVPDRPIDSVGHTLCLCHAALESNTIPPSIELPSFMKNDLNQLQYLSPSTSPQTPWFIDFFNRWTTLVPRIKLLAQEDFNYLERVICDPYESSPSISQSALSPSLFPRDPSTLKEMHEIATSMKSIASDILNCRANDQIMRISTQFSPPMSPEALHTPLFSAPFTPVGSNYTPPRSASGLGLGDSIYASPPSASEPSLNGDMPMPSATNTGQWHQDRFIGGFVPRSATAPPSHPNGASPPLPYISPTHWSDQPLFQSNIFTPGYHSQSDTDESTGRTEMIVNIISSNMMSYVTSLDTAAEILAMNWTQSFVRSPLDLEEDAAMCISED
ncbi:Serine/threonine-protein kinase [Ceratobasidium sp. AG-Ba]|nr:Serine/threonine-protein kinase [Ceratobasidium sp. AG-Ba]